MERHLSTENYYESPRESSWDQLKSGVARQLTSAAQTLHQQSARTECPTELTKFGEQAAHWLDRSANYIHDMEPQQLRADLEAKVRQNPGRSLLIAGLAGLVVGKLLRRR